MKNIFSILLILLSLSAFGQTKAVVTIDAPRPTVEGMTGKFWGQRLNIGVSDNVYYEWVISNDPNYKDDSVRFFLPYDNKKYKARVIFKEINDNQSGVDTVIVDNESLTYSPTSIGNVNSVNTTGWSRFDWDLPPNPAWCKDFYQGSCHFSEVANSTATYTFTGKRIEVWGERSANKGKAGFTISSVSHSITEQVVDLYSANTTPISLLWAADFPQGQYQITISVKGQKNPSASNAFVLVDKLIINSDK